KGWKGKTFWPFFVGATVRQNGTEIKTMAKHWTHYRDNPKGTGQSRPDIGYEYARKAIARRGKTRAKIEGIQDFYRLINELEGIN
ncbi:UNVERIFIED_CONTAM: hypothetical protein RF648_21145, partial [Kocuria sp. CPCC 205274]